MSNSARINAALHDAAIGNRTPLLDLLAEDVTFESSGIEGAPGPASGKSLFKDLFLNTKSEVPYGFPFAVGHVHEDNDLVDEAEAFDIIVAELVSYRENESGEDEPDYYTWAFNVAGGRITNVRIYRDAAE